MKRFYTQVVIHHRPEEPDFIASVLNFVNLSIDLKH